MWRIGFGLERIGIWAQARPVAFTLFLVLLTSIAVANLLRLQFDGNVTAVLPDKSEAYRQYFQMQDDYRNFARDVTILVESDRLQTARGLEDLRELQLEISLTDGIGRALSILSTPDFDPQTGELVDWFPLEFSSDEEAAGLLQSLVEKYPQAASLFSLEKNVAVIIASLETSIQNNDDESIRIFREMKKVTLEAAPDDFKILFTGLTPIGATIITSLISDQFKLTLIGLMLGTGIAFYIFRSFFAALVCAVPPALTVVWSLGLFAFFDTPINYLTTVLPTLALILAFADGIFLYFKWQTSNAANPDMNFNLSEAIRRVGPASSLTSLTTALAFLSFIYAQSNALKDFAMLGAGVVLLAFLAVIIGLPIVLHWSIRSGLARKSATSQPMFQGLGKWIRPLPLKFPVAVSLTGVLLIVILGFVQQAIQAEYRITDYLPRQSDTYKAELLSNEVIGGRSQLLVSLPLEKGQGMTSPENRGRIENVETILKGQFETGRIFSANNILRTLKSEEALAKLESLTDELPENSRSDLLSNNRDHALITVRLPSDISVAAVSQSVEAIRKSLSGYSFADEVVISGFPVLMSVEFTRLIDQLRVSLMIAISLGIVIVGIATRSVFITLAAITPNLLPIFFVQFLLYLKGGTINLSEVVALTVAFGIAIDNAVHLINVYEAEKRSGKDVYAALSAALAGVGPALAAGTVIICVSTLVTQISILPVVPVLGQLMIATLLVALLANLVFLPANILTLEKLKQWWINRGKAGADMINHGNP